MKPGLKILQKEGSYNNRSFLLFIKVAFFPCVKCVIVYMSLRSIFIVFEQKSVESVESTRFRCFFTTHERKLFWNKFIAHPS